MRFEKISLHQFIEEDMQEYIAYEDIKLPRRATKDSAGYDFFSVIDFTLNPGENILLPTGIKVCLNTFLPPDTEADYGYYLLMVPRSSLGFKYRLQLDNTVGVIDADYYNNPKNEGHIKIKITNDSKDKILKIKQGEAIAQGIISIYYKTEDDDATSERTGGCGSTNKSTSN